MVFGEYLVKLNVLTSEQVLNVIAYQFDSVPSLFTVCKNLKYLSEESLLKISLEIASDNDFIRTVQTQNLLSTEQIAELIHRRNKSKIPFGQVCVKLNYLNFNDAQILLGRYFKEQKKDNQTQCQPTESKISPIESKEDSEISSTESSVEFSNQPTVDHEIIDIPDPEIPTFEYKVFDTELIHEFCSIFDEAKKTEIENEIMKWNKQMSKDLLRNLYRILHTFKGTARFLGAHLLEFVIHNLESLLSEMILNADEIEESFRKTLEDVFLLGLDLMWDIRMEIIEQGTEEEFLTKARIEELKELLTKITGNSELCIALGSAKSVEEFVDQF